MDSAPSLPALAPEPVKCFTNDCMALVFPCPRSPQKVIILFPIPWYRGRYFLSISLSYRFSSSVISRTSMSALRYTSAKISFVKNSLSILARCSSSLRIVITLPIVSSDCVSFICIFPVHTRCKHDAVISARQSPHRYSSRVCHTSRYNFRSSP